MWYLGCCLCVRQALFCLSFGGDFSTRMWWFNVGILLLAFYYWCFIVGVRHRNFHNPNPSPDEEESEYKKTQISQCKRHAPLS